MRLEHATWQKASLYEASARVALLLRAPGAPREAAARAAVARRVVSLTALRPTLLAAADGAALTDAAPPPTAAATAPSGGLEHPHEGSLLPLLHVGRDAREMRLEAGRAVAQYHGPTAPTGACSAPTQNAPTHGPAGACPCPLRLTPPYVSPEQWCAWAGTSYSSTARSWASRRAARRSAAARGGRRRAGRRSSSTSRRSRWLEMPFALLDDGAPSASLDHRKAPAVPAHPGAPSEWLGGAPWPRKRASAHPKAEDVPSSTIRRTRTSEPTSPRRTRRSSRGCAAR